MKKMTWKRLAVYALGVCVLLYAVYMAIPRRLTMLIPDIKQAEAIALHHSGMDAYWTLTVKGEDMAKLIDHLDQFTFQPLPLFNPRENIYYGKVYDLSFKVGGTTWSVTISDQGDVGIENIFGASWLSEGKYLIQRDHIQVLPQEIEEQMERHEFGTIISQD